VTGAAGAGGAGGHRIAFIGEILLQQRHVRLEVPWMVGACETSEGDTQRVLASSPVSRFQGTATRMNTVCESLGFCGVCLTPHAHDKQCSVPISSARVGGGGAAAVVPRGSSACVATLLVV
jgi:hypothetical protein